MKEHIEFLTIYAEQKIKAAESIMKNKSPGHKQAAKECVKWEEIKRFAEENSQ